MSINSMKLIWLVMAAQLSCCQQLQGPAMGMPYDVSAGCLQALNTSVACPGALADAASSGAIVDPDGIDYLCGTSCLSDLQGARSTIASACKSTTDIVVYDNIAYPATFFVDSYILAYNLACRKDSQTGQYCDPQIAQWQSQGYLSLNQSCSDCWLGVQQLQLDSPLGFDPVLASNLAVLTSSCNATNYGFTTPTAYGLNASAATETAPATASAAVTTSPECTGSYAVGANDTCISISQELNVSTYSLLYQNNLDLYCRNFNASAGLTLCSPPTCDIYEWQASDSCASVALAHPPMTLPQFLAWNPNFNVLCQNAANFIGYQVCVSPPGGQLDPAVSTNLSQSTAALTAMPVPTNAVTGSTKNCGDWYTIVEGDTCALVSVAMSLTLSDFYFLNPEINSNCTNLLLGEAYCIEPVGDIHTYSGYPTTTSAPIITVPPASFSSVNTAITTATPLSGSQSTPSYLPKASGTLSDCVAYHNYDADRDNDCQFVAFSEDISTDQLLSWNTGLSSDLSSCSLQPGYSYCVALTDATVTTTPDNCVPVNSTEILAGTSSNCDCFIALLSYENGYYSCEDIASDYSITASQLTSWNTWLGSDCDNNLYADLDDLSTRPVCVGVNASEPVGSAASGPSPTTSSMVSTIGSTVVSLGPTATGEVAGCTQYYTVKSGDSCSSIETTYDIAFSQFFSWNPSIGSNCENLWLGYAYCVARPASSTSATPAASAPPASTQSGMTTSCDAYYTVVSGDSCAQIESSFGITFDQLYSWNPAVGDDCQNLWVGYAICVGVS